MLEQFLITELFAYLLIFSRVGAGIMLLPGIGEVYVPARIRLLLALSLALLLMPPLTEGMPPVPDQPIALLVIVFTEVLTGLFLGALARMMISAMHTAGTVIATQSGLAAAMMLDVTQTSQSTPVTNLLAVTAVTLLFAMNLHHVLLGGLAQSYELFPAGQLPMLPDFAEHAARTVSRAFAVAIQIASPHIVIGTILYLAAGVLSRLMPTMQIFFILMAPQMLISFFILMITLSGMMLWYMNYLETTFGMFVSLK